MSPEYGPGGPPRRFSPEVTVMGVPLPAEEAVPLAEPVLASVPAPSGPTLLPAEAYRPTNRPPIALLTAFDDGAQDGETVRMRGDKFRIGRTNGDFLIPHDARISSPHVVVTRERGEKGWQWTVADVGGTDGLFIRVSRLQLVNGTEFLAGKERYRFAAGPPPTLTRVVPGGFAPVLLAKPEYWIGTDPGCDVRSADPFLDPWHARVFPVPGRGWTVQHDKTLNGLWLRVPQVTLTAGGVCSFQIGEQRFRLRT